jgi:hypothetical protein
MTQPRTFQQILQEDQFVFIPPHVTFEGNPGNPEGGELTSSQCNQLKWMIEPVSSATKKIVLPNPARYKGEPREVTPKTIINFSGMPNASARTFGTGELEIHLGLVTAFASLPQTYGLVAAVLAGGTAIRFDQLIQFEPPPAVLLELDTLVRTWQMSEKAGWRLMVPALAGLVPNAEIGAGGRGMIYVVVGHELTHWFEVLYKEAEWERMMAEVRGHVATWLDEEMMLPPAVLSTARQALRDPAVLSAWTREFHADAGAFEYLHATMTHGGWHTTPEKLASAHSHMSFFFALNAMVEEYLERRGHTSDHRTHPPWNIRRAVFCHIQAKRLKLSQQDFMTRQFGYGLATAILMDRILDAYWNS